MSILFRHCFVPPRPFGARGPRNDRGQTFVEYTLLIGIIIAILLALTPMIKRGSQAMVKTISDEVGIQQGAEQGAVFSSQTPSQVLAAKSEGLIASEVATSFDRRQHKQEWNPPTGGHSSQTAYTESTTTATKTASDLGFTKKD